MEKTIGRSGARRARWSALGAAVALGAAAALAAPGASHAQSYGEALAVADGEVFVGEPAAEGRPGAVYVYEPVPEGGWAETGRLAAPEPVVGDRFGAAVAPADGHLLVGAPGADEGRGALHVFRKDAGAWRLERTIRPSEAAPGDRFGAAVAADGPVAVVGAPAAGAGRGAAWVLRRDDSGRWSVEGALSPRDPGPDDAFGASVALQGDRILVGSPRKNRMAGAAYVFRPGPAGEGWDQAEKLLPDDLERGYGFGSAATFDGERLFVGAPGFARATGAVYEFARASGTEIAGSGESAGPDGDDVWRAAGKLLPFDGHPFARFGVGLAVVGDELWVGAPRAADSRGRVYRFARDPESGRWTSSTVLRAPDVERGDRFGEALAVGGEAAVVAAGGDDYGAGTAVVLTRDAGEWVADGRVWSEPAGLDPVTGGRVPCAGGSAAIFDCSEVDLLSFLPVRAMGAGRGVRVNDLWGWTDPETGREYALVGMTDQTAFVDVTDPENPIYLGRLPMTEGANGSTWRDLKVHADHAFIVSDGAGEHGMQVFDLARLREVGEEPVTFDEDARYDRIHSAHNLVVDPETGFAYIVGASGGGTTCGGGLHMVDIREPAAPVFAGCFSDPATGRERTGYTHDAQCVIYRGPDEEHRGREICFGANETALSIADVTDKENPFPLAAVGYPNVGYAHQGWLTEDQRYFFMDDELDEIQGSVPRTRTLVWDVADLEDPILVEEFFGTTAASDHNLYIVGDRVYQSNYQAGLRILDISEPEDPREMAFFDTVPFGENEPGFGGSWSNYPFFESGNVVVTSGRQGLFVVRETRAGARDGTAAGRATSSPLAYVANQDDASVSVIDTGTLEVVETVDLTALGYSLTAKPHHTAVEPDGSHWYVSLISDGRVLKFDRTNRLVGEAEFETPGLLALDPSSDRLYVGRSMAAVNPPPRIGVIDRSDMSLEEIDVFLPRPHGIALGRAGAVVYAASLAENRIAAVDPAEERAELIDVEGPHHTLVQLAVSPDGRTLVATGEMSDELLVFDLADPMRPALERRIPVNRAPWHPAFTPDGREVWFGNREANTVTVVDAESWSVAAVIGGEGLAQPHGLAISPDGARVFVSNRNLDGGYVPPAASPPAEGDAPRFPGTVVAIDRESRQILEVLEAGRYAAGMSTRERTVR